MKDLSELERNINYTFKNRKFLHLAMTHTNSSKKSKNNERLEFLGDRVLALVIAKLLYDLYDEEDEGDLAHRLSFLVSKDSLYDVAKLINLDNFVISNEKKPNISILADACEALIGSVYLDGGIKSSEDLIRYLWSQLLSSLKEPPKHIKSQLQEWALRNHLKEPSYELIRTAGSSHSPIFTVSIYVDGFSKITAQGKSIKNAEQNVAKKFMDSLNEGS